MSEPYVPDAEYVERLAASADQALALVQDVWPRGIPVQVRDDAGLYQTARHVAYCAKVAEPDDEDMALYRGLVSGLPTRYALPVWRGERTIDRIVEWVRDPRRSAYVERKATAHPGHAKRVLEGATHTVRVAASGALREQGAANAQIAERLGCSERHVGRLLAEARAKRPKRRRWHDDEIALLKTEVKVVGDDSERAACFRIAGELGRNPETVHAKWKRLKRAEITTNEPS